MTNGATIGVKGMMYLCVSVLVSGLAVLGGCDNAERANASGAAVPAVPQSYPYKITTTVGMITDIVRQVAGDKAVVTGIIGEGVDPHLYRATASDTRALLGADVVFYNGLLLEGKMADVLIGIEGPVYAVTSLVEESYLLEPEEFAGHFDPHVWMDVKAWSKAVEAVAGKLSAFDSANASVYEANARTYQAKLTKLEAYARRTIATIPKEKRLMITAHDAFNYFSRAYDVEVMGVQGLSTESEAGLDQINRLVDTIVARKVEAVFKESSVPAKNIAALVEGTKNRGHEVKFGGELFSDAMGRTGTYEGTYIGMMDHNVTTMARALGGEAPPRGMQGKLSEVAGEH